MACSQVPVSSLMFFQLPCTCPPRVQLEAIEIRAFKAPTHDAYRALSCRSQSDASRAVDWPFNGTSSCLMGSSPARWVMSWVLGVAKLIHLVDCLVPMSSVPLFPPSFHGSVRESQRAGRPSDLLLLLSSGATFFPGSGVFSTALSRWRLDSSSGLLVSRFSGVRRFLVLVRSDEGQLREVHGHSGCGRRGTIGFFPATPVCVARKTSDVGRQAKEEGVQQQKALLDEIAKFQKMEEKSLNSTGRGIGGMPASMQPEQVQVSAALQVAKLSCPVSVQLVFRAALAHNSIASLPRPFFCRESCISALCAVAAAGFRVSGCSSTAITDRS